MTTSIEINKLEIYARHGVYEQETKVGNLFEVSISLKYDFVHAMESDNLIDTISYADVCEIIITEMKTPSKLLEHAAGRIIKALKNQYPNIQGGTLRIAKITPPISAKMKDVAITVNW